MVFQQAKIFDEACGGGGGGVSDSVGGSWGVMGTWQW